MLASDAQRLRYKRAIDAHDLAKQIRQWADGVISEAANHERDSVVIDVPPFIYLKGKGVKAEGYDVGVATRDLARNLQQRGFKVGFPGPRGNGDDGRLWVGWHAPLSNVLRHKQETAKEDRSYPSNRNSTGTALDVLSRFVDLRNRVRDNARHGVYN